MGKKYNLNLAKEQLFPKCSFLLFVHRIRIYIIVNCLCHAPTTTTVTHRSTYLQNYQPWCCSLVIRVVNYSFSYVWECSSAPESQSNATTAVVVISSHHQVFLPDLSGLHTFTRRTRRRGKVSRVKHSPHNVVLCALEFATQEHPTPHVTREISWKPHTFIQCVTFL